MDASPASAITVPNAPTSFDYLYVVIMAINAMIPILFFASILVVIAGALQWIMLRTDSFSNTGGKKRVLIGILVLIATTALFMAMKARGLENTGPVTLDLLLKFL